MFSSLWSTIVFEGAIVRVTLATPVEGRGRFYIHTTSEVLSSDNVNGFGKT